MARLGPSNNQSSLHPFFHHHSISPEVIATRVIWYRVNDITNQCLQFMFSDAAIVSFHQLAAERKMRTICSTFK
ncbi:hypothetical protein J6590_070115 [Homalodisca vitripennis]|nr:hypothetical protein J6590_070115 [Homalodisca vitripennis]